MEAVKNGELQQASVLFDRYNKADLQFSAATDQRQHVGRRPGAKCISTVDQIRNSYREGNRFNRGSTKWHATFLPIIINRTKNKTGSHIDVGKK